MLYNFHEGGFNLFSMAKYKLDFYRDKNGESEVLNFIYALKVASKTNKDARIQYNKMTSYINTLLDNGNTLSEKYIKHLDEDIWELRPGHNRVLYFCWLDNTFVMLHYFRKKTQKTPVSEIEQAKRERNIYIRRHK